MAFLKRIEIQPGFCILWAFLILTLPMKFLGSALLAAIFHEACHALAVRCLGGRILNMTIAAGGMVMEVSEQDAKGECLCALAGPAGSFLLAILPFPTLALCGLVQGLFNLLPIMPLDGGRILGCILEMTVPRHREKIEICMELLLFIGSIILGPWAVLLWLCLVFRKFPCKPWGKRVQ